jgi:hypothetical protein
MHTKFGGSRHAPDASLRLETSQLDRYRSWIRLLVSFYQRTTSSGITINNPGGVHALMHLIDPRGVLSVIAKHRWLRRAYVHTEQGAQYWQIAPNLVNRVIDSVRMGALSTSNGIFDPKRRHQDDGQQDCRETGGSGLDYHHSTSRICSTRSRRGTVPCLLCIQVIKPEEVQHESYIE